jgi:Rtf2 RING-finger
MSFDFSYPCFIQVRQPRSCWEGHAGMQQPLGELCTPSTSRMSCVDFMLQQRAYCVLIGTNGGSEGPDEQIRLLQVNPAEELRARWTTCRLSGLPLNLPCCVDKLGFIYNKDAVVQVRRRVFSSGLHKCSLQGFLPVD